MSHGENSSHGSDTQPSEILACLGIMRVKKIGRLEPLEQHSRVVPRGIKAGNKEPHEISVGHPYRRIFVHMRN